MAFTFTSKKNGREVTLLNPAEKGRKFAGELKSGKRYQNNHKPKLDKNGNHMTLSDTQKAYRSGYLAARKDSAKAWKAKNKR